MINLTGAMFGRFIVIEEAPRRGKSRYWVCRCGCGAICHIRQDALRRGTSRSCGCLSAEMSRLRNRSHGKRASSVYAVWNAMLQRCCNSQNKQFSQYGGRGIGVCPRWQTFAEFYTDMGSPPEGMTLDRKDNDKGYCKDNCRWATSSEQARNRRSNNMVTYSGTTKCLTEWAEALGTTYSTLKARLNRGWSIKRVLTTPVRGCRSRG